VFDGVRAAEVGLVTRAVPADRLDETVAAFTSSLVLGAPKALAGAKDLLHRPAGVTLGEELQQLTILSVEFFGSAEGREGIAAFREKRPAAWVPQS
jgi:methylglutaconyl-CoA hydratase